MADTKEDFQTLFNPIYKFTNATPNRTPLSDWYITDNAFQVGFQARSVVGGFFIKMLDDKTVWNKWANKGSNVVTGKWAPLKFVPKGTIIVPTANEEATQWQYTTEKPADNWFAVDFSDKSWKTGAAGFGSTRISKTAWNTSDIWIRRTVDMKKVSDKQLSLVISHDEDTEIYVNGILLTTIAGYNGTYDRLAVEKKVNEVLHKGINTIAVHCHQTTGGQFIDMGFSEL